MWVHRELRAIWPDSIITAPETNGWTSWLDAVNKASSRGSEDVRSHGRRHLNHDHRRDFHASASGGLVHDVRVPNGLLCFYLGEVLVHVSDLNFTSSVGGQDARLELDQGSDWSIWTVANVLNLGIGVEVPL
jgi:hypothetical protein